MKILVTGATGFIGNHLINELLKNDSNEIIATSRNLTKIKKFDWFNKVIFIPYDLDECSNKNLFEFFNKPDRVVHLAWDGLSNYNSLIHIEKNLINNYSFIKNLVSNGMQDISITGTCFEYGMINGCLSEDMPTIPSNSYAIAKDSLRKFVELLKKDFEFDYKWIRLFYMYGKGQSEKSLFSLLEQAIKNKDTVFNMSGGEQLRDYLHISKVAEYINKISSQNLYKNQIVNCCSGKPVSIRNLVETHLKERQSNIKLNLGFYAYPEYEPMAFWGDINKLKRMIE